MSSLWVGIATVAISGASAAYSANQSKKGRDANQANQEAFNKATQLNEAEARKLFDGFIADYNKSKEKLDQGQTLQEYIGNMVQTLDNPQLTEAYRKSRNGDWEQAQQFADQANNQNVSAFNKIVDNVGGGSYATLIGHRNAAALGENVDALYSEAQRLREPKTPEGSVVIGKDGKPIGGQRADKFEFNIATSTVKEQNDRSFAKTRTAIEDDRVAAQRQQDKAINFLPFLNYSQFSADNVVKPFEQNQLAAQLAELQTEAALANNAMGVATGKPSPPPVISTAASDAQTTQSTQAALGALASLYAKNNATSSSTPDSRASNSYNLENTMGSQSENIYR